jgi:hypothetical protein
MGFPRSGAPRRENDPRRQAAHTPDTLAALGRASASAKADNDATAADWWTSGGAKANQYREPMDSVKVIPKGSKGPSGTEIVRGSYRDN